MTNVSNKMLFAFMVVVGATVFSLGAFATTAHADDWYDAGSYDGGSWYDAGSYGGDFYDSGSYDSGWYDSGSYGGDFYDSGSYDAGWYETSSDSWYDAGSYNPGWYETDTYNPGYDVVDSYNPGYYQTDSYNPGYYEVDSYNPGYYEVDSYQAEYVQEYMNQYASGYTSGGSFGGGSMGGGFTTGGGYSMPKFSTGGCTTCHYQTPPPVYIPPAPRPNPTCSTCGGSNVTNTNINTNTNTIIDNSITDNSIFVDNSINDSFNTTVVGDGNVVGGGYQGVAIATLGTVVAQPIIQYQAPAPYCVITLTNAGVYNTQATLVWSSSNAQSAYIMSIGAVAPNGTRAVTGYANQTYSLTVTGQGGTYTCHTQPFTPTYVPPAPITPSVSLTQIPYTGLALGPVAQAMYWLSLLAVAAAGGYLLVYYKGGALALAASSMTRRQNHFVVSEQEATEIETPVVDLPAQAGDVEEVTTPVVSTFSLPTMVSTNTRDAMQMIRNAAGVPQIIINRA